jgi:acyl carrier protein
VSGRLIDRLRELPRADRRPELEAFLTRHVKRALLMDDSETLGPDDNYFELGLTSLRVTEIKQTLDAELDCDIPNAVLFGSPSVGRLTDHLVGSALAGLLAAEPARAEPASAEPAPAGPAPAEPAPGRKTLVDDVLDDLLRY